MGISPLRAQSRIAKVKKQTFRTLLF